MPAPEYINLAVQYTLNARRSLSLSPDASQHALDPPLTVLSPRSPVRGDIRPLQSPRMKELVKHKLMAPRRIPTRMPCMTNDAPHVSAPVPVSIPENSVRQSRWVVLRHPADVPHEIVDESQHDSVDASHGRVPGRGTIACLRR